MDGDDLINAQRGEGQGHEGGNTVADLEVAVLQILADVGDGADEHTAGAGDGILLLAALGDDALDHFADLLHVMTAGIGDLGKGCRVDVQRGHVHDDLVGVALRHIVVDFPCRLGQNALRLDDAVSSVFVSFQLCHFHFLHKYK